MARAAVFISLRCDGCGKTFNKQACLLKNNQHSFFCSKDCRLVSPEKRRENRNRANRKYKYKMRSEKISLVKTVRIKISKKDRSANHRNNNPALYMLYRVRKNCKHSGVECLFTEDWFKERLDRGVCEMSGIPFDMQGKRSRNSPSIDRIDPQGLYIPENCRIVLWSINRALSNYGEEYLLGVFRKILIVRGIIG